MKKEIIGKIANDKVVEQIITNITKDNDDDTLKDLSQMIYVWLMEDDEEKIESMYSKNQLNYYITRMVINNLHSKNSRYYYMFKKPEQHEDIKNVIYGEEREAD